MIEFSGEGDVGVCYGLKWASGCVEVAIPLRGNTQLQSFLAMTSVALSSPVIFRLESQFGE